MLVLFFGSVFFFIFIAWVFWNHGYDVGYQTGRIDESRRLLWRPDNEEPEIGVMSDFLSQEDEVTLEAFRRAGLVTKQ